MTYDPEEFLDRLQREYPNAFRSLARPGDKEAAHLAREELKIVDCELRIRGFSSDVLGVQSLVDALKSLDQPLLWEIAVAHVALKADPGKVAEAMLLMHGGK